MALSAAELAIALRMILDQFLEQLEEEILEGKVSAETYNKDFIEGMASIVETAEAISGVRPLPEDVVREMRRMDDES